MARSIKPPRLGAFFEIPEPSQSANSPFSMAAVVEANCVSKMWSTSRTEIVSARFGTSRLLHYTDDPISPIWLYRANGSFGETNFPVSWTDLRSFSTDESASQKQSAQMFNCR